VEYQWIDGAGSRIRLRIHGPDGTAPPGSNAASGPTYRIQIKQLYQDSDGNLYHRNAHNIRSPHYDPDVSNRTHIPWPVSIALPY
ncbi:MAG: polymorphic toxin type 30 domain-containing protein, partial [Frankia sp.]